MKKAVFFLFLSLSMMGCKKCERTNEDNRGDCPPSDLPTFCNDPLLTDFLCSNPNDRVAWLQMNGKALCAKELYECIVYLHTIDSTKFENLANSHPDNANGIKYYNIEWKEINDVVQKIKCYDSYVSFDITTTNIKPISIQNFDIKNTCYSTTFLKGIEKKFKMINTDTVILAKAQASVLVNGTPTLVTKIIFKIEKQGVVANFFDLSDFPGFATPMYTSCGI